MLQRSQWAGTPQDAAPVGSARVSKYPGAQRACRGRPTQKEYHGACCQDRDSGLGGTWPEHEGSRSEQSKHWRKVVDSYTK